MTYKPIQTLQIAGLTVKVYAEQNTGGHLGELGAIQNALQDVFGGDPGLGQIVGDTTPELDIYLTPEGVKAPSLPWVSGGVVLPPSKVGMNLGPNIAVRSSNVKVEGSATFVHELAELVYQRDGIGPSVSSVFPTAHEFATAAETYFGLGHPPPSIVVGTGPGQGASDVARFRRGMSLSDRQALQSIFGTGVSGTGSSSAPRTGSPSVQGNSPGTGGGSGGGQGGSGGGKGGGGGGSGGNGGKGLGLGGQQGPTGLGTATGRGNAFGQPGAALGAGTSTGGLGGGAAAGTGGASPGRGAGAGGTGGGPGTSGGGATQAGQGAGPQDANGWGGGGGGGGGASASGDFQGPSLN